MGSHFIEETVTISWQSVALFPRVIRLAFTPAVVATRPRCALENRTTVECSRHSEAAVLSTSTDRQRSCNKVRLPMGESEISRENQTRHRAQRLLGFFVHARIGTKLDPNTPNSIK